MASKLLIALCLFIGSCVSPKELWVRSGQWKVLDITEGARDGQTIWFVRYVNEDNIIVYEMAQGKPSLKPGDVVTGFIVR